MIRALTLKLVLLCSLLAAAPAHALTVQQQGAGLRVTTASYSALVDPTNGARITSLQVDGAETTHLCPDGDGGLFEETHTADFPFEIVKQESDDRRLTLTLAARAGTLRVVKEFTFSDDAPYFTVRLTFENSSPFDLSGADAPAVRNLVLPAGGKATGRELYCTARGRGAEVLSADFTLARAYGPGSPGVLRWMAVAEPAGRRALGFALLEGGSRPLPPLRAPDGGLLTGWAVPTVPAGSSLSVNVLVVPLSGFTAVAEINRHFAADALVDASGAAPVVHLTLMPLEALPDLSVVTRTYDATGKEMEPCDPLLMDRLQAFKLRQGDVTCPATAAPVAWFVPEVYSSGSLLGTFAVPVGQAPGPRPVSAKRSEAGPVSTPLPGQSELATPKPAEGEDFVLYQFDGPPAAEEAKDVSMVLPADGKQTLFFGIRALHAINGLRVAMAPADASQGGAPVPPSALYLWHVTDDAGSGPSAGSGPACLEPLSEVSLAQGQTAYIALTADAARLDPGAYSARLVISASPVARELPVDLRVLATPAATADAGFGLWYLGADGGASLDDPALQKLLDYGVRAVTLPLADATSAVRTALPGPQPTVGPRPTAGPQPTVGSQPTVGPRLGRMRMLAFASAGGVLPPAAPSPGDVPLPCPDPLYLVRTGAATSAAVQAAVLSAYSPALLCERLSAVQPAFFQAAPRDSRPVYLVRGGPEPGAVPKLIAGGRIDASAPVFLYMDLRGVDWRRAAVQVRSAAWSAAYQGLAGLAVDCEPPAREVDRQLAVWHVLRDAVSEAALWRRATRLAATATASSSPPRDAVLARAGLDVVIGLSDSGLLPVRAVRVPFRQVYEIAPATRPVASLSEFAAARRRTLELAAGLAPLVPATTIGDLYWRGIPFAESGQVRWTIFAPGVAPDVRQAAQDFESGVERLTGQPLPIVSDWPEAPSGLIWAFVDDASWSALPDGVQAALDKRSGAAFLTTVLPDGTVVAVVSPTLNTNQLLASLLRTPTAYAPASGVR